MKNENASTHLEKIEANPVCNQSLYRRYLPVSTLRWGCIGIFPHMSRSSPFVTTYKPGTNHVFICPLQSPQPLLCGKAWKNVWTLKFNVIVWFDRCENSSGRTWLMLKLSVLCYDWDWNYSCCEERARADFWLMCSCVCVRARVFMWAPDAFTHVNKFTTDINGRIVVSLLSENPVLSSNNGHVWFKSITLFSQGL